MTKEEWEHKLIEYSRNLSVETWPKIRELAHKRTFKMAQQRLSVEAHEALNLIMKFTIEHADELPISDEQRALFKEVK